MPDIKSILPYEGDIIYEGRWGQSFRLGSTVNNANIPNTWSSAGENGDPITILRNNQYDDGNDPWVPQVEDINQDNLLYDVLQLGFPLLPSPFLRPLTLSRNIQIGYTVALFYRNNLTETEIAQ